MEWRILRMEWPWLKLHQRHHPCCRPFCPVALEPSDAAFFSFPGTFSQRGLTFGPSRVQRTCFAGQECTHRPTLLAVALTGIDEKSTKIHFHIPWKSLFSSHALLFFREIHGNPICNPEPWPAAPLGVVARPCRARQPERHGETLSAGGQDLVRDVLGRVHKKIIPLESHWSPWSFYVTLDGMDSFHVQKNDWSFFKSGNHQVYDKSMVYPNGQPWKDPIPSLWRRTPGVVVWWPMIILRWPNPDIGHHRSI